jgi:hypothetical protein
MMMRIGAPLFRSGSRSMLGVVIWRGNGVVIRCCGTGVLRGQSSLARGSSGIQGCLPTSTPRCSVTSVNGKRIGRVKSTACGRASSRSELSAAVPRPILRELATQHVFLAEPDHAVYLVGDLRRLDRATACQGEGDDEGRLDTASDALPRSRPNLTLSSSREPTGFSSR